MDLDELDRLQTSAEDALVLVGRAHSGPLVFRAAMNAVRARDNAALAAFPWLIRIAREYADSLVRSAGVQDRFGEPKVADGLRARAATILAGPMEGEKYA